MIRLKFYVSGLLEYFLRFLVFPVKSFDILLAELFPAHSKQLLYNGLSLLSKITHNFPGATKVIHNNDFAIN